VQPAVFLDRDNTLIANDGDLGDPARVELLEGVAEGLHALRSAGYRLVVITNQAGVARGMFSEQDVDAVHQRIAELVDAASGRGADPLTQPAHGIATAPVVGTIDRFYYCPYHPDAALDEYRRDHPWRKPRPGMILQAARDMRLDLARSWVIGDQQRDVLAGAAAGCRTILITGDGGAAATQCQPTATAVAFAEAVEIILREAAATPLKGPRSVDDAKSPPAADEPPPPPAVNGRSASATARRRPGDGGAIETAGDSDAMSLLRVDLGHLRQAVSDLGEELRTERARRADFTPLKLIAGLCQLLVLLLAMLGLLQLGHMESFVKWMISAVVVQLLTITLLLADSRG
jgi:histidinol-phosphate phosphatase family protein